MPRSALDSPDEGVLIRYLVGAIAEPEAERLDELSIVDDDVAARLRAIENDLVDAYVRGELSGETLDLFQSNYLTSSAGREKVRFAEALTARPATRPESFSRHRVVPNWALALAASLLIAVIGYPIVERAKKTHQTAPLVLLPVARGIVDNSAITIRSGSGAVTLRLQLASDTFPRYQAALKDPATDRTIWRSAQIQAVSSRGAASVPITVDTAPLQPQRYVIELTGFPAAGPAKPVSSYSFRLAR